LICNRKEDGRLVRVFENRVMCNLEGGSDRMERITQWGTSNFWYSRIIIRMGKSREMVRTIREMRNTQKKFNWKTRREDTIREAYNITMVSVFAGCKVV
jgi:hypothetical protein